MSQDPDFGQPRAVPAGRAVRGARLGGMALGIAGKMAVGGLGALGRGERPEMRDLLLTPGNMKRVADELARMRGAAMKLGQLVSMDTGDVLSPELAQILARLRAEADFMPPKQLKGVLEAAWPKGWLGSFAKFDVRPIAAASIGQVHRATLKDGRDLAIKVQYPGVADSIDSDVANVALLAKISGLLPKGFDIDLYVDEAKKQLHAETDYPAEGAHLARFATLLQDDPRYVLPTWVEDWTRPGILAMTYVDSVPLEAARDWSQDRRNRLAQHLIELVLRELFEFQLMQTDPNLANYRLDPTDDRLVLLDFGATRALSDTTVDLYRRLFVAAMARDWGALEVALEDLGLFEARTKPSHRATLLEAAKATVAWMFDGETVDFADRSLTDRLQVIGRDLARDGFIPPPVPIEILFLQRKLGGVALIAADLRANLPMYRLLEDALTPASAARSA